VSFGRRPSCVYAQGALSAIERVAGRLFEREEAVSFGIERIVARLGLRERRGLGVQAETEPSRLHQVVITAKPYASTPSKSTTLLLSGRLLGQSRHVDGFSRLLGGVRIRNVFRGSRGEGRSPGPPAL
jgi:hypothetical protein